MKDYKHDKQIAKIIESILYILLGSLFVVLLYWFIMFNGWILFFVYVLIILFLYYTAR